MARSVVEILISTVRSQAEATLAFEQMRIDGVDEFTTARVRRSRPRPRSPSPWNAAA